MEFRWVAFIALWTTFVGPVLGTAPVPTSSDRPAAVKSVKTLPISAPAPHR